MADSDHPVGHTIADKKTWLLHMLRRRIWLTVIAVIALAAIIAAILLRNSITNTSTKPSHNAVVTFYQSKLPSLKKAAEDHPDDANAHKSYAVALYASGDPAAARVEYEKVVRLSPKDALAYNNLGNIYRDLHETDKAIAAYKKAIDLNPRSVNTYANLASVQQHNQERIDEAIATYQQGLKVLPDDSQLQLLLGLAYEANHDTTRAVQTYKNILTHDPGNTAAKANLTRVTASSR